MCRLNVIGIAWVLLSVISTICITVGFYLPYWIAGTIYLNGSRSNVYIGVFRRCNYPIFDETLQHFRIENLCGRYSTFADIPSFYWQLCTLLVGFGCGLSILLTTLLIPTLCFRKIFSRNSCIIIGFFQVVSAIAVSCGCLIYPLGWNNPEVKDACGNRAAAYSLGECHVGWSYVCVLVGSALKILCGILSICPTVAEKSTDKFSKTIIIEENDFHTRQFNYVKANTMRGQPCEMAPLYPTNTWHI